MSSQEVELGSSSVCWLPIGYTASGPLSTVLCPVNESAPFWRDGTPCDHLWECSDLIRAVAFVYD